MKLRIFLCLVLATASLGASSIAKGEVPDTAFTYQGHLKQNGEPAEGDYDFEFGLWDAEIGGNQIDVTQVLNNEPVSEGLFTVQVDFGAEAFDNSERWLQIKVNDTILPRQPITRTPYSIQTRGIFVNQSKKVGIGTNSPSNRLTVAGGDADFTNSVGIGTPDPNARLHVVGDAIITTELVVDTIEAVYIESEDISISGGLQIGDDQDTDGFLGVRREQDGTILRVESPAAPRGDYAMKITQNQSAVWVGIGGPGHEQWMLEVYGPCAKPGGGSWSNSSDRRLKKNIRDLDGTLEKVLSLRGVSFEYIDPEAINELSGERIGMIAQEVERVFPDWVDEGADGYKFLTVRGFTALTVEALRELRAEKDAQITELQARITALEGLVQQFVSPSHGGAQ